jgi:aminoglycoside phosphotransferase (APT) family kinase protein
MEAAARHDVPAPEVLLAEEMDGQPVLVTTWCPGEPALQALERSPGDAHRIGMAMGGSLGRLHQIAAPDGLAPPDRWIDRGGDALIDNDEVAGIIDWENTLPGPPHMDVARSRAILRSVRIGKLMPAAMMTALDEFEEGLVAGHASVVGADPHPELSTAWGMAMTVDDLAGQAGKPESWVTGDLVEELREKRDRLIEAVINT